MDFETKHQTCQHYKLIHCIAHQSKVSDVHNRFAVDEMVDGPIVIGVAHNEALDEQEALHIVSALVKHGNARVAHAENLSECVHI